ncbi:hypothetical protein NQ318_013292 [Aromia moschata]|uniref:Uncharacterized protein n=1 Tax=Aromia moschata TaxID=1265417 RepID=A0AAV8X2H3_9CUCU|nr:hypothetical protein NQ318_013292 [Aromia moschata]
MQRSLDQRIAIKFCGNWRRVQETIPMLKKAFASTNSTAPSVAQGLRRRSGRCQRREPPDAINLQFRRQRKTNEEGVREARAKGANERSKARRASKLPRTFGDLPRQPGFLTTGYRGRKLGL